MERILEVYSRDAVFHIANELLGHIAIAMGEPDGEDSSGRQKFALMAPADVATRALDIAEELVEQGAERGHIVIHSFETKEEFYEVAYGDKVLDEYEWQRAQDKAKKTAKIDEFGEAMKAQEAIGNKIE